jgi:hypothetical protein
MKCILQNVHVTVFLDLISSLVSEGVLNKSPILQNPLKRQWGEGVKFFFSFLSSSSSVLMNSAKVFSLFNLLTLWSTNWKRELGRIVEE